MKRLCLSLLMLLAWCGFPDEAVAAVTCKVESSTDLDFGVPGFPLGPVESTSQVTVSCKGKKSDGGKSALVCVGVNSGNVHPRSMEQRVWWWTDRVYYDIYRDPAHSEAIDFSVNASRVLTLGADGRDRVSHTFVLYGRLVAPQPDPATGDYVETVPGVVGYQEMGPGASCDNTPATDYFNFTARTRLAGSCIVSANDLSFGQRDSLPASATTSVQVVCTKGTKYKVRLNDGLHASAGVRRMLRENDAVPPPDYLQYDIYLDADDAAPCSPAVAGVRTGTGTDGSQLLLVCGQVPAQAAPVVGRYSDTVTVTVEY